jgi:hypothetical protein
VSGSSRDVNVGVANRTDGAIIVQPEDPAGTAAWVVGGGEVFTGDRAPRGSVVRFFNATCELVAQATLPSSGFGSPEYTIYPDGTFKVAETFGLMGDVGPAITPHAGCAIAS